jgi:hypothetical protein
MSSHYRTWQQHHIGRVLITVELEPAAAELSIERHRSLADLAGRLVDLFTGHRIGATWAVGEPARSRACAAVIRAGGDHEIAILGDSHWMGQTAGRTRFARELAFRVAQARSAGIQVKSLVPRGASLREHVDLVLKQGLSAVAGVLPENRTRVRPAVPNALHYGVWELPTSERLPLATSWLSSGRRSLVRRMWSAARDASMFHLVIDAPAVEREAKRGERTIALVARRVAEWRDRGWVQVETLSQAAARLANVPAVTPQRSILRRAA